MSARDCVQGTCLCSSRGSVPAARPDPSCQPGSWSQTWSGCPSPAPSVRGGQAVPASTPSLPCSVTCRGLVLCMRKGLFPGNSPGRRAAGPVWEDGAHEGSQDPAVGKSSRAFPQVPRQAPPSPRQAPRNPGTSCGARRPRRLAGVLRYPPRAGTASCCCPSARAVSAVGIVWGHQPGPTKALPGPLHPEQPTWSSRRISSGILSP